MTETDNLQTRVLAASDLAAFQALRAFALRESPSAFLSTPDEERALSLDVQLARLGPSQDRCVVGVFDAARLVAIAGISRDGKERLSHKAMLWGVYVLPEYRGRGVGREVVKQAVARAAQWPRIVSVHLGVNAANAVAIALYESLGFTRYGLERNFMQLDGVFHDEVFMTYACGGHAITTTPHEAPPVDPVAWTRVDAFDEPGISGTARVRTRQAGATRLRVIDFSSGYVNDWCARAHVVFVLTGALAIEREDGSVSPVTSGMACHIAADARVRHRVGTTDGARAFVVD